MVAGKRLRCSATWTMGETYKNLPQKWTMGETYKNLPQNLHFRFFRYGENRRKYYRERYTAKPTFVGSRKERVKSSQNSPQWLLLLAL